MVARRILFLDAARLTAFHWQGGHVQAEGEFAPDAVGMESFGEYLGKHRHSLFYLLADVAEEGFQLEDIPHVTGSDRLGLIKRKLGQYYYGTPLAVAMAQGRLKEGRRDERMLFAALTRPQHFEPWLEALRQTQAPLAGVFSLSQVVGNLSSAVAKDNKRFLIITLTRGGLRQTFFEDGQLRFSRLAVLATGSLEESAVACAIEAAKIFQYLAGQRLVQRGTPLPVFVLAHPAQTNAFRERCRDSDDLRFEYVDLVAESGRAGLKNTLHDSHGEALFAHLLIRKTPREQFAHAEARRYFHLWQIRFALRSVGAVTLAGCLLFAGKELLDLQRLNDETSRLRIETAAAEQRYQAALDALPKIPLSNDNLRALVDRYNELAKRAPGPKPMYLRLSSALKDFPRIEIERLDWAVANHVDDAVVGAGGERPQPPRTAATAMATGSGPFAVVDVYATLPVTMVNDHREQLEIINGFADRLRADPAIQVRILSLPFDVESGKALKSSGGTIAAEAPKFSLRVAQRL
jgi:hypothetical protein